MSYRSPKGVFDILPQDPDPQGGWRHSHLWNYIETKARAHAHTYGFREIRTPLFEHTELFARGIGKETDIVSKEMYTFEDRAGRSLTLRPEGTAPVMRAFIEHNLAELSSIQKFFYLNPMFRYERSQAGRYRQHHQFGAEVIGSSSPLQDVEVIDFFYSFLTSLGLRHLTLHLNSIGQKEERDHYKERLKHFLKPHVSALSEESQARYVTNPLRILDSKDPQDKQIVEGAPTLLNSLEEESKRHFETVCSHLDDLGLPYRVTPSLVRGLDYYNRTVFEVTAEELGAQNSVGGGGRYDGLLKELGGPDVPAMGFGMGIERILQTSLGQNVPLPPPPASRLLFIPLGEKAREHCFRQLTELRRSGIAAEMDFSGKKLKSVLQRANQMQVQYVMVVGEEELQRGQAELKEMLTGKGEMVEWERLEERVQNG